MYRRLEAPSSQGEPRAKSPRGPVNDEDLREMVAHVSKLSIQTSQTTRQLVGSLWATYLLPPTAPHALAGLEAGQNYNKQVMKKRKGHGLGPPHPHVVAAVLEAIPDMLPMQGNAEHTQFIAALLDAVGAGKKTIDSRLVEDLCPHMICRKVGAPSRRQEQIPRWE